MKKLIRAILVIVLAAALGCGGYFGYIAYKEAPKRAIIGTWNDDALEDCCLVFNKDGTMSGKIMIAESLNMAANIEGIYVIDTDANALTITYKIKPSPLSIDLKRSYEFTKDGKLILIDESGGRSTYTKVW